MVNLADKVSSAHSLQTCDAEAIRYLRREIAAGKHWFIALLGAIGLWSSAEEARDGHVFRYLIDGEAFDWLLLAERLCEAVADLLPDAEKDTLLFHGELPLEVSPEQVKEFFGSLKYNQYLNYFYGISVEKALIQAVKEEVYKERQLLSRRNERDVDGEAYRRIYGATKTVLLKRFRKEKSHPSRRSMSLTELKEFNYWLFKYRLVQCDKARVASDTRKGLKQLKSRYSDGGFFGVLATESLTSGHG
jgi:hypothetical protein